MKARQRFSSLLFLVTSTTLPWDFYFFKNHATSYSFFSLLLCTVKEKVGKPNKKAYPLPYGLKNSERNLKFENSRLCPETSSTLYVHEFGFCTPWVPICLSLICQQGPPISSLSGRKLHIQPDIFPPDIFSDAFILPQSRQCWSVTSGTPWYSKFEPVENSSDTKRTERSR